MVSSIHGSFPSMLNDLNGSMANGFPKMSKISTMEVTATMDSSARGSDSVLRVLKGEPNSS